MTYNEVTSLRETIEKIILNQDQYSISPHHQQQITSIYKQAIYLQKNFSLLEAAPSLKNQIRKVVREAEEVIENFIAGCKGFPDKSAGNYNTNFNQQLEIIRENIYSTTMDVRREVMRMEKRYAGNTTEDEEDWHLSDSSSILSLSLAESSSISSVLALANKIKDMDSLDDDSVAIKSRLCGGSSQLQIIPIVGMGGIGKTTLAMNVYNDPLTMQYFDVRVWVTVSQDFSKHKIVSSIMHSMKELITNRSRQGDEITIFQNLKFRRYLIVMDDMWSKRVWKDLRHLFPEDNNGSRIILTTRLSYVAAYPDSHSPLHQMRFLSIDQSWNLLRQKVFVDEDCPPILENTGKRIAGSCRGLPLAIVVIAGLLSGVEKNLSSWEDIARNVSLSVGMECKFDEILSLSYTHLPDHLRHCFLYMGGFPEDHKIHISKLVKLWVADESWIQSKGKGSSKSLEEEAEECLEELVKRNLVLVTERKFDGKIKSCSLHDLIRDMCIRKGQENKFFLNLVDTYVGKEKRFIKVIKDHPRISVKSSSLKFLSSPYCSTIHTVMCFRNIIMKLDFLKSVRLLRVLDVENLRVDSLPDELFDLFQLRYLAIDIIYEYRIPAAISKLQNLQTLIINARNMWKLYGRDFYHRLPQEIWMMPQLRHLICYSRLPDPAEATSTLENLQTLSLVSLDMCSEGILEKIPNIKKLGIDCSHYEYDTHLRNLAHLHQLESLKLRNADWRKESISFPRMLRNLTLCNMSLPWNEMSIVGSLPNLQVLKLRDLACIGSTWETSEGEFPELQFLLIETSMLQHWITESDHFPRLKFLFLHDCWNLNEIPEGIGEIATLELIDVKGFSIPVPKSLAESAKRIIEEQESLGNDALQVHYHSPNPKFRWDY
ncbi:hypothetical protein C2S51_014774 [Perilla frutescens var. frutescens]|nr:hypothetical protein C2S51_014774 [Perilla frutescens var. frutescens]